MMLQTPNIRDTLRDSIQNERTGIIEFVNRDAGRHGRPRSVVEG